MAPFSLPNFWWLPFMTASLARQQQQQLTDWPAEWPGTLLAINYPAFFAQQQEWAEKKIEAHRCQIDQAGADVFQGNLTHLLKISFQAWCILGSARCHHHQHCWVLLSLMSPLHYDGLNGSHWNVIHWKCGAEQGVKKSEGKRSEGRRAKTKLRERESDLR